MFDILIANPDRHNGNIVFDKYANPPSIYAIDHGHALFGKDKGIGIQRFIDLRERLGVSGGSVTKQNRHCFLDQITKDTWFEEWISKIGTIPDHYIKEICQEAIPLGISLSEAMAATNFLNDRKRKIRDLINGNRNEFRISIWSLFTTVDGEGNAKIPHSSVHAEPAKIRAKKRRRHFMDAAGNPGAFSGRNRRLAGAH